MFPVSAESSSCLSRSTKQAPVLLPPTTTVREKSGQCVVGFAITMSLQESTIADHNHNQPEMIRLLQWLKSRLREFKSSSNQTKTKQKKAVTVQLVLGTSLMWFFDVLHFSSRLWHLSVLYLTIQYPF
jgi:hypothetical protein